MDIIEMIGKELDDFALQAARLYNAGFDQDIKGREPLPAIELPFMMTEPIDQFYFLGIEHGAAWRKLRAELGLIKKED
jgi:hypothetical protein